MNKYHLKILQDTFSRNTRERATQKQSTSKQKKKRYKTDPASCDNQSAEF